MSAVLKSTTAVLALMAALALTTAAAEARIHLKHGKAHVSQSVGQAKGGQKVVATVTGGTDTSGSELDAADDDGTEVAGTDDSGSELEAADDNGTDDNGTDAGDTESDSSEAGGED